jgi:type VI protein secretion system component VasF
MADGRHETLGAVENTLENMKSLADRHPETPMSQDTFNVLLDQARRLFPDVELLKVLTPMTERTNAAELVARLSVLAGALGPAMRLRPAASIGQVGRGRLPRNW